MQRVCIMETYKKEKIFNEEIKLVELIKVFHLYQRRNEWVNWDGDTNLISRSGHNIKLTLEEAEASAEQQRKQGSKFFIDEIPALKVSTKSGFIIITEQFSSSPLKGSTENLFKNESCESLSILLKQFLPSKWFVQALYDSKDITIKSDSIYFSRISSPGDSLCWSLKKHTIDESPIKNIALKINKNIECAIAT